MHLVAAIPLLAMRTFLMARSPPREVTYSSIVVMEGGVSVEEWRVVVVRGVWRSVGVWGVRGADAPLERNAVFTLDVNPVVTAMTVAR